MTIHPAMFQRLISAVLQFSMSSALLDFPNGPSRDDFGNDMFCNSRYADESLSKS